MPGARGPSTDNIHTVCPLIPAYARTKLRMFRSGSGLPGQFGLVECLAMEVFQEVGIDLVGDSGGGIRLVAIDRTVLTREDRFAARSDVVISPVKAFGDTILTQE